MKPLIRIALGALALMAGAAAAIAGPDVVDQGAQASSRAVRDQAALNACADAFLASIAPGTTARPHLLMPVLAHAILSPLRPSMRLEVTLEARSGGHEVLASATCEADYHAKVTHLYTSVLQPGILARRSTQDITFVLASRL
ncbi:MAG: hypothetical protein ACRD3Q_03330 [Terriglobales bacterium]